MIQTQSPLKIVKKSRLMIKKKSSQSEKAQKYSCLFRQRRLQPLNSLNLQQELDPLKILVDDVFCYRHIKSITRNDQYISLKLKQTDSERLCISNHINRFKASDSKTYRNFGKYLELFDQVMKKKSSQCSRTDFSEAKNIFEKQLQEALEANKDKKYIMFYYEPSAKLLNFTQILISNLLLKQLGKDPKEFCQDFLKYKHLFFEIFETSLFEKIVNPLVQNHGDLFKMDISFEQLEFEEICHIIAEQKNVSIKFIDTIFRTIKSQKGLIQQKLGASFRYSKPQVNIDMIELDSIDEENVIQSNQKEISKFKLELIKSEQTRMEKEIESMRKLMHSSFGLKQKKNQKESISTVIP